MKNKTSVAKGKKGYYNQRKRGYKCIDVLQKCLILSLIQTFVAVTTVTDCNQRNIRVTNAHGVDWVQLLGYMIVSTSWFKLQFKMRDCGQPPKTLKLHQCMTLAKLITELNCCWRWLLPEQAVWSELTGFSADRIAITELNCW